MSEENKSGLVKAGETRVVKALDDVFESIERAQEVCSYLLQSKLCPVHLYEKGADGKPDYTKGRTPSLVMVAFHGKKLGFDIMTSMQQVVPVNGLMSVKGDGAKALILNSGKIEPGSWKEERFGSIEDGDLVVKITASRIDTKETLSRSFSVEKAKRAGLWITETQASGSDGWKFRNSAWYKYPERMIQYRALGFLARDLFPDVMSGTYTTEEAMDMPIDQTVVIDQGDGVSLHIPDKGFAEERSKKITGRAVDKIEGKDQAFTPVDDGGTPTSEETEKEEESSEQASEQEDPSESDGKLTLKAMENMPTEDLLKIVQSNNDMVEAMMLIPGKNTNKKLREIIFAFNEGSLDAHVGENRPEETPPEETPPDDESEQSALGSQDMPPNTDFDNQQEQKDELIMPETTELNKYKMDIPAFNKGNERDFAAVKELYQNLLSITPRIDNEKFIELQKGIPDFANFKNKEDFCKYATIEEVCTLLNENYISL